MIEAVKERLWMISKDTKRLKMIASVFENEVCSGIMNLLVIHPELNVTQIYVKLRKDQSTVSQQLSRLRKLKIVRDKRKGKNISYVLNIPEVVRLSTVLIKV